MGSKLLNELNIDVLVIIFDFCSNDDLANLCISCPILNWIINTRVYPLRSRFLLQTGWDDHSINNKRTQKHFSYLKRIKLASNWTSGKYEEILLLPNNRNGSQILLEKDFLYATSFGQIKIYKRNKSPKGIINDRRIYAEIGRRRDPDVISFVKKNETIFAGRFDGSCLVTDEENYSEQKLHDEFITSVDLYEDIYISSSCKATKIWRREDEMGLVNLEEMIDLDDCFHCVRVNPQRAEFVGGKFKDSEKRALKLVDLSTGVIQTLGSETSSVYHIKWKDENVILTGNYDTSFRVFDCRTDRDEQIWVDPYDASVYCLDYDGLFGVLCGMKYNCRVNLYDLRVPNKFIQMYFPSLKKWRSSPVYSVTSDISQMFIATDQNIRVFNFNNDKALHKDYSNIFMTYR